MRYAVRQELTDPVYVASVWSVIDPPGDWRDSQRQAAKAFADKYTLSGRQLTAIIKSAGLTLNGFAKFCGFGKDKVYRLKSDPILPFRIVDALIVRVGTEPYKSLKQETDNV